MENKKTRKEKVYQVVKDLTKKTILAKNFTNIGMDAYVVSIILKIDRPNASKELNDLWREGRLIKIQGRPILYLALEEFVNAYPIKYIPTFIPKGKHISDYLEEGDMVSIDPTASSLDSLIGSHGSLSEQIISAKAAINYPPHGLATLLCGNLGIGKMQFAHDMYDYAIQTKRFSSSAKFIIINCMDYSNNNERLRLQLLGNHEKKSKCLIEQANGGILFFDEIQKLDSKGKELIIDLIYKGTYTREGETTLRDVNAMIIASTTETPESPNVLSISKYFPVILQLPDIDQRDSKEKIGLILDCFCKEALSIKMPIRLSKDILFCFAQAKYKTNNTQLKSEVKLTCSRAFLDNLKTNSRVLTITFHHLSNDLLDRSYLGDSKKKIAYLLDSIQSETIFIDEKGNCNDLDIIYENKQNTLELDEGTNELILSDYTTQKLNSLNYIDPNQKKVIKGMLSPLFVDTLFELVSRSSAFSELSSSSNLFIGLIQQVANTIKRTKNNINPPFSFDNINDETNSFLELSNNISESIQAIYNMRISNLETQGICSYLSTAYSVMYQKPIGILVISHGEHIAEEMLRFIRPNDKDNFKIFGLDYGYEESLKAFLPKIFAAAQQVNQGSGVLVITDMLPFESIQNAIFEETSIKTSIITPLNLPLLSRIVTEIRESSFSVTLDSFKRFESAPKEIGSNENQFIQKLTDDFLSDILTFINPIKAVSTLKVSLDGILEVLRIQPDDSIIVKFITHTTSMLERVIKKEVLDFHNLKSFTKQHSDLIQLIENQMRYTNETFGIKIPPSELAFIAEIFIPYIQENHI